MRELHERAGRRASGRFIVEGPHAVEHAMARGLVRELWVRDDAQVPADWSIDVTGSAAVIKAVSQTQHPQGVLAVCAIPTTTAADVFSARGSVVILDRLADPGNVGTLIRTAVAAGAAGIILTAGSVDACNDKVVRSAAGTWFEIPIAEGLSPAETQPQVQASGRPLITLDADADDDLYTLVQAGAIAPNAAWVIGSEAHGVDPLWHPDLRVRIPMAAGVESLNAAVAGALCLYAHRHAPANRASARDL